MPGGRLPIHRGASQWTNEAPLRSTTEPLSHWLLGSARKTTTRATCTGSECASGEKKKGGGNKVNLVGRCDAAEGRLGADSVPPRPLQHLLRHVSFGEARGDRAHRDVGLAEGQGQALHHAVQGRLGGAVGRRIGFAPLRPASPRARIPGARFVSWSRKVEEMFDWRRIPRRWPHARTVPWPVPRPKIGRRGRAR